VSGYLPTSDLFSLRDEAPHQPGTQRAECWLIIRTVWRLKSFIWSLYTPRNIIRGNRYCATLSLPCHFWGVLLVSFTNRPLYPRYETPIKGTANPITSLDRPWGFKEVDAPRFQDNRHVKVVMLSALRTDRLYSPSRKYSWYSFLLKTESTSGPQSGRKDCVNEKFQ